jgi:hypothetical protein
VWSVLYGVSDEKLKYVTTQTVTLSLSDATAAVSLGLELTYNSRRLKKTMLKLTFVGKILIPDRSYFHKRMSGIIISGTCDVGTPGARSPWLRSVEQGTKRVH